MSRIVLAFTVLGTTMMLASEAAASSCEPEVLKRFKSYRAALEQDDPASLLAYFTRDVISFWLKGIYTENVSELEHNAEVFRVGLTRARRIVRVFNYEVVSENQTKCLLTVTFASAYGKELEKLGFEYIVEGGAWLINGFDVYFKSFGPVKNKQVVDEFSIGPKLKEADP